MSDPRRPVLPINRRRLYEVPSMPRPIVFDVFLVHVLVDAALPDDAARRIHRVLRSRVFRAALAAAVRGAVAARPELAGVKVTVDR